jgi:8-hydroxy-5-deazaflavin:NADPH oxidoreductase
MADMTGKHDSRRWSIHTAPASAKLASIALAANPDRIEERDRLPERNGGSRDKDHDMKIGIIGAGYIGRALASLAKTHGDIAMISNSRGPATLGSTKSAIGCEIGSVNEAVAFGEVIVLAVPFRNVVDLPAYLLDSKIMIDTCNYYPERDSRIAALDRHETTTSSMVAAHFAGARVVKAFNAILAKDIETTGSIAGTAGRRALPIAGDDQNAKDVVIDLLGRYGFDAVDAGSLLESWRFERAKPAYCIPLDRDGMAAALAAAQREVELPHGSWRR